MAPFTPPPLLLFSAALLLFSTGSTLGSRHLLLTQAQAAPPPTPNSIQDFLQGHNKARAGVGVPPLRWSYQLAREASRLTSYQRDKKKCQMAVLNDNKYGSNQEWSGGPQSAREVVASWVQEKIFYNYTNNSCMPEHFCGVYTQVVWRTTTEVGCGQAVCGKGGDTISICLYNPPGNYVGERPY